MKFKVGNRVRVTEAVTDHRRTEIGKIVTITNVNGRGLSYYGRKNVNYYDVKDSIFIFYEDELELVPFTKSDLKDGWVVEYRDGNRRMVLGNVFTGLDGFSELNNYDENLINKLQSDCNIDRIYTSSACILDRYFDDEYLTLIWERPKEPIKKMTVAEIEKELGYKVEIVAEN